MTDSTRAKLLEAYDAGYRAGEAGLTMESCPHEGGTDLWCEWANGWNMSRDPAAAIARDRF